jgi:hypothetical protein
MKDNTMQNKLIVGILLMLPLCLSAQKERVEVVRSFEARLLDAEKLSVKPVLPPLDTTVKKQQYEVVRKNLDVDYPAPVIRPLAITGIKAPESYGFYAKIGGGLPNSLFGDLAFNTAKENKFDFGIAARHHSANNTAKLENQQFSTTGGSVAGTVYTDQGIAIRGRAGYEQDNVFFYGYNNLFRGDTTVTFAKQDVRQRFSILDLGVQAFNAERTIANVNYDARVDAYFMQDAYASKENGFDLNLSATKWIQEKHALRLLLRTDFNNYKDTASQSLNNFFLQPNFTFVGDKFRVKAGLNLVSNDDKFYFFPDVEVSAAFAGTALGAFVGAEGSLQKNTFRTLSAYNPFISSRNQLRNTQYQDYFGGIKGVVQGIDYRVQAGYKTTENLATFLASGDTIPRFDVLYDSINIVYLNISVVAPLFKGFEISGKLQQNYFDTGNRDTRAWHLPSFTLNGGIKYTTDNKKAAVRADLFLENGMPYLDLDNQVANLNALFDLSLGLDYHFTKHVGMFLQVNNMANNRRQRWQHYPVFGLNALAGISARF